MTTRRTRDLKRRLLALAEPVGAKVDIDRTGRDHLRATFRCGAQTLVLFFALTPSDFRNQKNETAYVKRRLRVIGG